jgi:hypothetical protein
VFAVLIGLLAVWLGRPRLTPRRRGGAEEP